MGLIGMRWSRVQVPHDPDEWMELREALAYTELEKAQRILGLRYFGDFGEAMGGDRRAISAALTVMDRANSAREAAAEINRRLAAGEEGDALALPAGEGIEVGTAAPEEEAPVEAVDEDDENVFRRMDMDWLAARLVKRWSYRDAMGRTVRPSVDMVRLLDPETRDWLHGRVRDASRAFLPRLAQEGN